MLNSHRISLLAALFLSPLLLFFWTKSQIRWGGRSIWAAIWLISNREGWGQTPRILLSVRSCSSFNAWSWPRLVGDWEVTMVNAHPKAAAFDYQLHTQWIGLAKRSSCKRIVDVECTSRRMATYTYSDEIFLVGFIIDRGAGYVTKQTRYSSFWNLQSSDRPRKPKKKNVKVCILFSNEELP